MASNLNEGCSGTKDMKKEAYDSDTDNKSRS
jgi:hypothetical protein